jgi:hypothetical protein
MTPTNEQSFNNAYLCHICKQVLGTDRVRDHDHLTGEYLGAAHNDCALERVLPSRVPVFFHNLKNYDGHIIIKAYDESIFPNQRLTIIPTSMEKYVGFFVGDLAFLDSLAFLPASWTHSVVIYLVKKNYISCDKNGQLAILMSS